MIPEKKLAVDQLQVPLEYLFSYEETPTLELPVEAYLPYARSRSSSSSMSPKWGVA